MNVVKMYVKKDRKEITMRISRRIESPAVRSRPTHRRRTDTFSEMMQTEMREFEQEELQHLMDEITEQGERLARFHLIRDLIKFKRFIREFLEKTVHQGLHVKKDYYMSVHGQGQTFSIVEEIDQKLLALTEMILHEEKENVKLLELIGEIKGLLINFYR